MQLDPQAAHNLFLHALTVTMPSVRVEWQGHHV